jgi:hypothetical protein
MIPKNLLPENPTQFDYLHAIRALASRQSLKDIFDLADAGMFAPSEATQALTIAPPCPSRIPSAYPPAPAPIAPRDERQEATALCQPIPSRHG